VDKQIGWRELSFSSKKLFQLHRFEKEEKMSLFREKGMFDDITGIGEEEEEEEEEEKEEEGNNGDGGGEREVMLGENE
jgi:hypothetical protein